MISSSRKYDQMFAQEGIKVLPWVGQNYADGLMGRRVLVVGASKYCLKANNCPRKCQGKPLPELLSVRRRGCLYSSSRISKMNRIDIRMENYSAYREFVRIMDLVTGGMPYEDLWSRVAFMNLIQPLVFYKTTVNNLQNRQEYYKSVPVVMDAIKILRPNLVVLWGWEVSCAIRHWVEINGPKEFFEFQNDWIMHYFESIIGNSRESEKIAKEMEVFRPLYYNYRKKPSGMVIGDATSILLRIFKRINYQDLSLVIELVSHLDRLNKIYKPLRKYTCEETPVFCTIGHPSSDVDPRKSAEVVKLAMRCL